MVASFQVRWSYGVRLLSQADPETVPGPENGGRESPLLDRDETAFTKVLEAAVGTMYNFTCRAKMEFYQVGVPHHLRGAVLTSLCPCVQEQSRVRYGVQKILPLDFQEEGNYLKELLSTPWAQ